MYIFFCVLMVCYWIKIVDFCLYVQFSKFKKKNLLVFKIFSKINSVEKCTKHTFLNFVLWLQPHFNLTTFLLAKMGNWGKLNTFIGKSDAVIILATQSHKKYNKCKASKVIFFAPTKGAYSIIGCCCDNYFPCLLMKKNLFRKWSEVSFFSTSYSWPHTTI